jgi:hypothetical protein
MFFNQNHKLRTDEMLSAFNTRRREWVCNTLNYSLALHILKRQQAVRNRKVPRAALPKPHPLSLVKCKICGSRPLTIKAVHGERIISETQQLTNKHDVS